MERLFSPCSRLYALLESQGLLEHFRRNHPQLFQELNLNVSTEELLSAERAFTYADLYAMLGNQRTILWLTPHAAVVHGDAADIYSFFYRFIFVFKVDGKDICALAPSLEALLEIVDIVRRLLVANARDVYELGFRSAGQHSGVFFNAPMFANLMEQCQNLKALTLEQISLDEDHCRVLGDFSKPGLEMVLDCCEITVAAGGVLAQVLGCNQGPTKLDCCDIDNSVLADGLRGNSRLKSLRPRKYSGELLGNRYGGNALGNVLGNREVLAIAGGLKENKGLVDLDLRQGYTANEEAWDTVCNSLKTHPTLEILNLGPLDRLKLAPLPLRSRIQTLTDMLKVNMSIHTIRLDDCFYEHKLYRGSVIPYLETNRLRPRLLAIQKALPIEYRAKVLGRALVAVRTDPNRFWMLLSGNAEVAFP
jgi:hypothetical protein